MRNSLDKIGLDLLIENELYSYILAISNDEIKKVTKNNINDGINWFIAKYKDRITKDQVSYIVDKTLQVLNNKGVKSAKKIKKSADNKDER